MRESGGRVLPRLSLGEENLAGSAHDEGIKLARPDDEYECRHRTLPRMQGAENGKSDDTLQRPYVGTQGNAPARSASLAVSLCSACQGRGQAE
jgi:hypothetical protein